MSDKINVDGDETSLMSIETTMVSDRFLSFPVKPQWYQIDQWWQVAQKNGDHDDHGHLRPRAPQNRETIGTPISDERGSRSQGNMGTPRKEAEKRPLFLLYKVEVISHG